ncbi:MAG TPA: DUF998 domain-containing protein, partial [Chitinophagaceae bacterium]|nr:DUF998 domain-containing protein [Chitinophagaceae bacterium]
LMFLSIGFGAVAFGKTFRFYSIVTILVFILFGVLTALEAPYIDKNGSTPFIGLWERINIAAFMVWLIVFAVILLRVETKSSLSVPYKKEMSGEKRIFNKQESKIKETV